MATQLRGARRPKKVSLSIMKHIKVTIFTDGLIMKFTDENDGKHSYKRTIPFPRNMQKDVMALVEKEQARISGGILEVEVFETISIELGGFAM